MKQFSILSSTFAGLLLTATASADLMHSNPAWTDGVGSYLDPHSQTGILLETDMAHGQNAVSVNGYQTGTPWHLGGMEITHGSISVVLKQPNIAKVITSTGTLLDSEPSNSADTGKASLALSSIGGRQQQ